MTRFLIFMSLLFSFTFIYAQSADNLKQYPLKREMKSQAFSKTFSDIALSGAHYFKSLQTDNGLKSISDTSYNMSFKFTEKNNATLTCMKDNVNLTIYFTINPKWFNTFFNHLSAALPANYVYTIEYDAGSKQSNYTFFAKQGTKTMPSNYPEKVYMITDMTDNVLLTFLLFR